MITISFEHINKTPIEQALNRLSNMPLPIKAAHTVAKLRRQVVAAIGDRRKVYTAAIQELATKDENGNMVYDPTGVPAISAENQDKLAQKTEEVLGGELTIDWRKLEVSEIASCQLTANEIEALTPLVNGLDEAMRQGILAPTAEAANA